MKTVLTGISIFFLLVACRTSAQVTLDDMTSEIPNLVNVTLPETSEYTEHQVYVDTAELTEHDGEIKLLIRGHFPNPCCNLNRVKETVHNGQLSLNLSAWQAAGTMCAQVLDPFSYLHEIPEQVDPEDLTTVVVNGTSYDLKL